MTITAILEEEARRAALEQGEAEARATLDPLSQKSMSAAPGVSQASSSQAGADEEMTGADGSLAQSESRKRHKKALDPKQQQKLEQEELRREQQRQQIKQSNTIDTIEHFTSNKAKT